MPKGEEKKEERLLKNQPSIVARRPLGMQIPSDPLGFFSGLGC